MLWRSVPILGQPNIDAASILNYRQFTVMPKILLANCVQMSAAATVRFMLFCIFL